MKTLIAFLFIVTLVMSQSREPIKTNDHKWIRSTVMKDTCRRECDEAGGHVCEGLHKKQCCQQHWCQQDDKFHEVYTCRIGFEIYIESCDVAEKRDSGFLQKQNQHFK